jgi:hypothetical protein
MDILVALWTRDVSSNVHSARGLNSQISAIGAAVRAVRNRADHYAIPGGQAIRGVLICPEYFMSSAQHGAFDVGLARFRNRSVSHQDKVRAINALKVTSQRNPGILVIPGTIAWTKSFLRDDGVTNRVQKVLQEIAAARAAGIAVLRERNEVSDSALIQILIEFYIYAHAVPTHNATIMGAMPPGPIAGWSLAQKLATAKTLVANDTVLTDYLTHKGLATTLVEFRANLRRVRPSLDQKRTFVIHTARGNLAGTKLMRNTAVVLLDGVVWHKYHKHGDYFEVMGDNDDTVFIPGNRDSVTSIHGIKFGFEICLDHNLGTLVARVPPQQIPDIHIVCSDTVSNELTNIHARPGGFFLHASSVRANTAVYKIAADGTKQHLDHTAAEYLANYNIPGYPINADNELELWRIDLQGRPRLDVAGRTLARALVVAVTTWEADGRGGWRRSANSERVGAWIKANAHTRSEADLQAMVQWLIRTPATVKPAFLPANIDRLSNNGHLFVQLRDDLAAWNLTAM